MSTNAHEPDTGLKQPRRTIHDASAGEPRRRTDIDEELDFTLWCQTATPFREDHALDEDALRAHLRRLSAARIGIYLTSPAAGEGESLTTREHRRIYDIGVEEAKGKVGVAANVRPSRSAAEAYDIGREAIAAGVDHVAFYQMLPPLGMVPTQREQEAFWYDLLDEIHYPVALAFHSGVGYQATVPFIVQLCEKYEHIRQINTPPAAYTALRDALPARVKITGGIARIPLGSAGAQSAVPNVIPRICQGIVDGYRAGDAAKIRENSLAFERFSAVWQQGPALASGSHPSTPRWLKMDLKVLGLGNGVLRPPYLPFGEEDHRRMAEAFARLRIRELEGLAEESSPVTVG